MFFIRYILRTDLKERASFKSFHQHVVLCAAKKFENTVSFQWSMNRTLSIIPFFLAADRNFFIGLFFARKSKKWAFLVFEVFFFNSKCFIVAPRSSTYLSLYSLESKTPSFEIVVFCFGAMSRLFFPRKVSENRVIPKSFLVYVKSFILEILPHKSVFCPGILEDLCRLSLMVRLQSQSTEFFEVFASQTW